MYPNSQSVSATIQVGPPQLSLRSTHKFAVVVSPVLSPVLHQAKDCIQQSAPPRFSSPTETERSAATSHLRGMNQEDHGPNPFPVDGRRNKLGYQRSSMACGHCRRRKIRCVPPITEDPQGRCSNCIRLKKECVYYPVDHAGGTQTGRRGFGSISSATGSPQSPAIPSTNKDSSSESQYGTPYEHHDSSSVSSRSVALSESDRSQSTPYLQGSIAGEPPPFQTNFSFPRTSGPGEWGPSSFPGHPAGGSPYWTSAESTPTRPGFPTNTLSHIASSPNHGGQYGSPHLGYENETPSWAGSRSGSFSGFDGGHRGYTFSEGFDHSSLPDPMSPPVVSGESSNLIPTATGDASQMPAGHGIRFLQPWIQPQEQHGVPHWYSESGIIPSTLANDASGGQFGNLPQFYGNGEHAP